MPSSRLLRNTLLGLLYLSCTPLVSAETLTVSAAASLTNAFRQLGQSFEAANPADKIVFNFAASDVLVQQIAQGAPVDVLATADEDAMDKAAAQQLLEAGSRKRFAGNSLVLVVPADASYQMTTLAGLNQPTIQKMALGNPASVPAGRYAKDGLTKAKLWPQLEKKAIYTQSVRQSLDYVARAEVEAGFVYVTDALLMKDKVKVVLRVPLDEPITYPIATIAQSQHKNLASRFSTFVQSASGQAILAKYGFTKP
ncbi:molybdate ABC transporter substrate-binding protein [Leeia oryzae]|uniref:molybdate ABC transporter substrate-binding protein n=1 Tax=Leeia oryzae TaxID=356662 RepID=UPI00036E1637|nr:molybdate ABC transporter substrate-binding protein [Leeia oryzae]